MPPRLARLLGLGAFGAGAGLAALYLALVVFLMRPSPLHGMDWVNAAVAWISLGGLFAALIGVHVVLGQRLLQLAREAAERPPA